MRILKEVTVEVTQKCNSLCIFCSSLSDSQCRNEIPFHKLKEISRFSLSNGATTINFSGGEPLLRNDLAEIISFNESIGLHSTIYSSGNIADRSIIETITDVLKSKRSVRFILNYPSVEKTVFQTLVNSKCFEPSTIDSYLSFLIKNGIEVEAHIVPNAINLKSLCATIAHLKKIGVKRVSLLRLVLQGRAEKNRSLLVNDNFNNNLKAVINEVVKCLVDTSFTVRLGIPFGKMVNADCECFAGINKLIFRYDGVVFPCEAFKEAPNNSEFILGNIYEDSLESIWTNHPVHGKLSLLRNAAVKKAESCPAQLLY